MGPTDFMKLWPAVMAVVALIGAASVAQFQLASQAQEVEALQEDVEENADDIELLQRQLIQRQGEVELRTQRIELEQKQQGKDLDKILMLLQGMQDE